MINILHIGIYPGTEISGNYKLGSGSVEKNNTNAFNCANDLSKSYTAAMGAACMYMLQTAEMAGSVFPPGVCKCLCKRNICYNIFLIRHAFT